MFICGLLSTYIFPVIIKDIYSKLPSSWIAFESLIGSISGLLISVTWKNRELLTEKKSKKIIFLLFSYFG